MFVPHRSTKALNVLEGFVPLHLAKDALLCQAALHYKLVLFHTRPSEGIPLLTTQ